MTQRPIKFRAWDKTRKKMLSVCQMDFRTNYDVFRVWGEGDWTNAYYESRQSGAIINPDDTILMQFTGLHDKNGKEIWEGDVVRKAIVPDQMAVITWDEENAKFQMKWHGYERLVFTKWFANQEYEVIGNIYENKELLK